MGHEFFSVEYIPTDQDAILTEVMEIRSSWHEKEKAPAKGGMVIKVGGT